jgi:hypothetical protein
MELSLVEIPARSLPDMAGRRLDASALNSICLAKLDGIDKGTNVGLPFNGSAPDLGPFETAGR